MGDSLSLQGLFDLVGIFRGADRCQQIPRQVAAVMKIFSLAIIRSPADKEKIYFRRWRGVSIDISKRGVLRQHTRQVSFAAFVAAQVSDRRRLPEITPQIDAVP